MTECVIVERSNVERWFVPHRAWLRRGVS
jgi:hypothetical protein